LQLHAEQPWMLCELIWVLRRVYGLGCGDCVEAGLRLLAAGGDFADGVIAFEGRALGAQALVTFDREAARLLQQGNEPVVLLAER
jgi:hypothetical protein